MHWNYQPPFSLNPPYPVLFTYCPQTKTYNWTYLHNQISFPTVSPSQETFTDKKIPTKKTKKQNTQTASSAPHEAKP